MKKQIRIAVMTSGAGSNAEKLFHRFPVNAKITVCLLITNDMESGAVEKAKQNNVPVMGLSNANVERDTLLQLFIRNNIDFIVLAGFLRKIPEDVVSHFADRIVNIHPSLLPKFGGKGMYGMRVHRAVIESHAKRSGITIHLVNEEYDKGRILLRKYCQITVEDTPETLARKIHRLEHRHFGPVLEKYITQYYKLH